MSARTRSRHPLRPDLERHWQYNGPVAFALWPLSGLYCAVARLRRRRLQRRAERLPVPVVVVGNITVGGTGKTPMVIWLAEFLHAQGLRPGIVSRGYGGRAGPAPQHVTGSSDARVVGDEAVVMARRTRCPVWVCPDRVAAARALLARHAVDVIISDDGLQHYRLGRDIEIAMIDGARRFGNGLCLPAGPLREPLARLAEVDFRVVTGSLADAGEYAMELTGEELVHLRNPGRRRLLSALRGRRVHAVAGVGNPDRFFWQLRQAGLEVVPHPFPDHYSYRVEDLQFDRETPIIMTEKDAVKCGIFADHRYWYLPVKARPEPAFSQALFNRIKAIQRGQETARDPGVPGHQGPARL